MQGQGHKIVGVHVDKQWTGQRGEGKLTACPTAPDDGRREIRGQDYKEKHRTRLKTNVKRTVLNNTKLRHF